MQETMQREALSISQKNIKAYLETHDVKYIAEDAVFRNLSTGQEHKGRAEIGAMLHMMYHVAFDARAEVTNFIITEDKAMFEGFFRGKHIGEFMGTPATNREVNVPLCVTYDLKEGLIKEGRIYFLGTVLMEQLGIALQSFQKTAYVVRDIFQLRFGHFRDAKKLLEEAIQGKLLPETNKPRVLTDFTGDAYRLIFEEGFDNLTDYELSLTSSMKTEEWQQWYERFKPHVERSYREILKQVI